MGAAARAAVDHGAAPAAGAGSAVQVVAFAMHSDPDWRWRIVNYAGETVEESSRAFSSIAEAVSAGSERLRQMDVVDVSARSSPYGSTSYLRRR